jgi:hypothetical protein
MCVLHITDVTTTTGSTKKNNRPLPYQHPMKGHTRYRQVDNALVRRKDFKNFREKKFKQKLLN